MRASTAAVALGVCLLGAATPAPGEPPGPDSEAARSWDHDLHAGLRDGASAAPFRFLLLPPGETLRYHMRTVVRPPWIPLLSSGKPVVLESWPEFTAVGFGAEGYDMLVRIDSRAQGASFGVEPRERARLALDARGRPPASLLTAEISPEVANALQLFRDLTGVSAPVADFEERKTFVFHPSGLGVTHLEVDIRYQPTRIDPATGWLETLMSIRETPDERRRGRGFSATGTMTLAPDGTLVAIRSRGSLWKKLLFARISVPADYEVELLERRPLGR